GNASRAITQTVPRISILLRDVVRTIALADLVRIETAVVFPLRNRRRSPASHPSRLDHQKPYECGCRPVADNSESQPHGHHLPLPVRLMVCGLSDALSLTERVPLCEPTDVGVKVTAILQLAPGARVDGQLLVCAKSSV